jgi:hypothetical protein
VVSKPYKRSRRKRLEPAVTRRKLVLVYLYLVLVPRTCTCTCVPRTCTSYVPRTCTSYVPRTCTCTCTSYLYLYLYLVPVPVLVPRTFYTCTSYVAYVRYRYLRNDTVSPIFRVPVPVPPTSYLYLYGCTYTCTYTSCLHLYLYPGTPDLHLYVYLFVPVPVPRKGISQRNTCTLLILVFRNETPATKRYIHIYSIFDMFILSFPLHRLEVPSNS